MADIIESTAQKIRPGVTTGGGYYKYENHPNRPNGTWNIEMGYGLVDAYEAVKKARDYCWKNIYGETIDYNKPQVNGCVIDVKNTEVLQGGTLDLNATEKVIIDAGFKVEEGATLKISVGN